MTMTHNKDDGERCVIIEWVRMHAEGSVAAPGDRCTSLRMLSCILTGCL